MTPHPCSQFSSSGEVCHFHVYFHVPVLRKEEIFNGNFPGFPGGAVVKNSPASAGDAGSSPGPGRSHMPQSN